MPTKNFAYLKLPTEIKKIIIQADPNKTQAKQKFLTEEWKEIKNCDKLQSKTSLLEHMLRKFRANWFINTGVKWKRVKWC